MIINSYLYKINVSLKDDEKLNYYYLHGQRVVWIYEKNFGGILTC